MSLLYFLKRKLIGVLELDQCSQCITFMINFSVVAFQDSVVAMLNPNRFIVVIYERGWDGWYVHDSKKYG